MFTANTKQYLFRLSSGKTFNMYHKENAGIVMSQLNKRSLWQEPSLIMKEAMPNFSACMDDSDIVHVLCQDKNGNIFHLRFINGAWDASPVLNSKKPSPYDKHLQIICAGGKLIFFYVLEYSSSHLLSYQVKDGSKKLSSPKVIDYVTPGNHPYDVLLDNEGTLYAFYRFSDDKYSDIGYRAYIPSEDQWGDFVPALGSKGESEVLSVITDSQNSIHVCWQRCLHSKYELMYTKKSFESEHWGKAKTIIESSASFLAPSIISARDKLIIYWIRQNNIYCSISANRGDSWSNPSKYSFYDSKANYRLSFFTNVSGELDRVHIREVPGNFVGGYKLAFINDFISRPETAEPDSFSKMLADTVNTLSKTVDELRTSIKEMDDRIRALELKYEQLENTKPCNRESGDEELPEKSVQG